MLLSLQTANAAYRKLSMQRTAPHFVNLVFSMLLDTCVNGCVCLCLCKQGDALVCVLEKEGGWFLGKVWVWGVCMEAVETDSRIPFALVSVGLDQV